MGRCPALAPAAAGSQYPGQPGGLPVVPAHQLPPSALPRTLRPCSRWSCRSSGNPGGSASSQA
eukprot:5474039-Alexandrium_andersonii.AAC.1